MNCLVICTADDSVISENLPQRRVIERFSERLLLCFCYLFLQMISFVFKSLMSWPKSSRSMRFHPPLNLIETNQLIFFFELIKNQKTIFPRHSMNQGKKQGNESSALIRSRSSRFTRGIQRSETTSTLTNRVLVDNLVCEWENRIFSSIAVGVVHSVAMVAIESDFVDCTAE